MSNLVYLKIGAYSLILLAVLNLPVSSFNANMTFSVSDVYAQDSPSGSDYFLWEEYGGMWCDAEKEPPSDGEGNTVPGNMTYEDDMMCWAAAACNVLEWTGWGLVDSFWSADEMFDKFKDYWFDKGGFPVDGWQWWFDGTDPGLPDKDVPGGGEYWSSYNFFDYVVYESNETLIVPKIDEWLSLGYGVVIGVVPSTGSGGHYITCWGFNYDPLVNKELNPQDHYLGVWLTDSDDDKASSPPAPDALHYYDVIWNGTHWSMPSYYGGYCFAEVMALKPFPSNRPVASAGPPRSGNEGVPILLDASGSSDADEDSLQFRWDFDSDGVWDTGWSASVAYAKTWYDEYSGEVVLQVYDGHLLDTGTTWVTVNNVAPTVDFSVHQSVDLGNSVSFSGNYSDSGTEDTHVVDWDFGDGSSADGTLTPTHVYGEDGVYPVTLTVRDDDGGVGNATVMVTVDCLADWRMFHQGLTNEGYSAFAGPDNNFTRWVFTTEAQIISSPVVRNDRVYFGSNDRNVYCLDVSTGEKIWNFTTESVVHSSPAVVDGRLYVGSNDFRVYCLNATTGLLIWSYRTGYYVDSSPAVADGKVYFGSWDHKFYCLDAFNGAFIWSYTIGGNIDDSSPVVVDGRVYVGSYSYNSSIYLDTVYCFDAVSGAKLWSYRTGGHVTSSPAVSKGKLYVGCNDKKLYCLDAVTGALVWNFTAGDMVCSSPAVAHGRVYVGSLDGNVYCLGAVAGGILWSCSIGNQVSSSPAIADTRLYVGSYDENVYCLDAFTGEIVWSYETDGHVYSSPSVADGMMFICSMDTNVYAFGVPSVTYSVEASGVPYLVAIRSNSLISEFAFNQSSKTITWYATSTADVTDVVGFCSITFPTGLLGGPYTVLFDDVTLPYSQDSNATHTTLSFSYTHSMHKIEVVGTNVIPEVSSMIITSILLALVLFIVIYRKRTKI